LPSTSFTTDIATRNRPDALELSLPLLLQQSVQPDRVIIVDSSDDPSPTTGLVRRLSPDSPVPILHQVSKPGISYQRNLGLDQVTTDVTFLPDDDSLLHPGALAEMLAIYDQDSARRIGGVCAVEAATPPENSIEVRQPAYRKSRFDQLKVRVNPQLNRLENRHAPDPMKVAARRLADALPADPPWMAESGAVRVEWMTGFRMSFRTASLKAVRFNELLGRYSLFEDVDAGLQVMRGGQLLVAATRASIYHHRAPGNRSSGRVMGAIQVLNRAYVTCRSGLADPAMHRAILRHARVRLLQVRLLGLRNSYERSRYEGARQAVAHLPDLLAAPADRLDETYLRIRAACIASE
jgi:glycosyltransferase involved in cell wall biosynthesis